MSHVCTGHTVKTCKKTEKWMDNKLTLNIEKTKVMVFGSYENKKNVCIKIDDVIIKMLKKYNF